MGRPGPPLPPPGPPPPSPGFNLGLEPAGPARKRPEAASPAGSASQSPADGSKASARTAGCAWDWNRGPPRPGHLLGPGYAGVLRTSISNQPPGDGGAAVLRRCCSTEQPTKELSGAGGRVCVCTRACACVFGFLFLVF